MATDLDVLEAIVHRRRSVRAFLPRPVERQLIERTIRIASQAPSSCNTQPWIVHVVSGERLDALGQALRDAAVSDRPTSPDVARAMRYTGVFRARQVSAAHALFAATGVDRHDPVARHASVLRNYAFFGAPHAAFLFLPPDGGLREAADCGKFAQTFMLALAAAGIGSCAQGSLSFYPDVVRETLGITSDERLLLGISFGYADAADPAACVRVERCATDDLLRFH